MPEKSKRFGCPKCGNDGRDALFREINIALVDNYFEAFGSLPGREGLVDKYVDCKIDFEGAKPLARGAYQCSNCDAYFDMPAELPDSVQDSRNPDGEPLRTDLVVPESEVVWSDTLPATVVISVKRGVASLAFNNDPTLRVIIRDIDRFQTDQGESVEEATGLVGDEVIDAWLKQYDKRRKWNLV